NGLAILLQAEGKNEAAERLFQEALSMRRALTPDHFDVAGTLYQLAMFQVSVGKNAEAIASMEEAVGIWRRVLGNEPPYVGARLSTLGTLYRNDGQLDKAEPLLRESVEILRTSVKDDDPNWGGRLYNLAKLLQ